MWSHHIHYSILHKSTFCCSSTASSLFTWNQGSSTGFYFLTTNASSDICWRSCWHKPGKATSGNWVSIFGNLSDFPKLLTCICFQIEGAFYPSVWIWSGPRHSVLRHFQPFLELPDVWLSQTWRHCSRHPFPESSILVFRLFGCCLYFCTEK